MADAVTFVLGSAVTIGIAMAPLGAHCAPQQGDKFSGPDVARTAATIELHSGMVPGEEGFLELAPFFDQTTLKKLRPSREGLKLMKLSASRVVGAMTVGEDRVTGIVEVAAERFQECVG
jgi:hypothetical protein